VVGGCFIDINGIFALATIELAIPWFRNVEGGF